MNEKKLYKTGELAKEAGVLPSTIRYYTKMGILSVAEKTSGGFNLYDYEALRRLQIAQGIKSRKWSLDRIRKELKPRTIEQGGEDL